jgi:hypothetical protein
LGRLFTKSRDLRRFLKAAVKGGRGDFSKKSQAEAERL